MNVHLSGSVWRIGCGAFRRCVSLQSVNIPEGVEIIENVVFLGCTSLQSIYIPESVTEIGGGILKDCSSLQAIHMKRKEIEKIKIVHDAFDDNIYNNSILYVPPETLEDYRHHFIFGRFKHIEIEQF